MYTDVADSVRNFIKVKKHLSIKRFAGKAEVAEKTISRLLAGERVSRKSLLGILNALHGNHILNALDDYRKRYPDDQDVEKMVQFYKEKNSGNAVDQSVRSFAMRNIFTYQLNAILSEDDGVTKDEICEVLGSKGIELLDQLLVDQKAICLPNGNYRLVNVRNGFADGDSAKAFNSFLFNLYDSRTFATKDSQIGHLYGWSSEEGIAEIKKILIEALIKCAAVEKKYPGRISFAIGTGMVKIFKGITSKNKEALS